MSALHLCIVLVAAQTFAAPSDSNRPSDDGAGQEAQNHEKIESSKGKDQPRPADISAPETADPRVFEQGLSRYYADDFVPAAAAMYHYISTNEPTVENYEWGEYFLGVSLKNLGFTQGAAEYLFNVAQNRSRPEILPDALSQIEELVARPHDEDLIENRLLADSEFGYLPSHLSGFVAYHKGLADLRDGRLPWAERLFAKISEDSPYRARAWYAIGVHHLREGRNAEAVTFLRRTLQHPKANREIRNLARLALARLLYEAERYAAAEALYREVEIPELTTAEASLFLEQAWTSYWLRDYRRTMGILYALEAPSYADYFAPERHLLRALVLKNQCHYIPAKREIRRFRFTYESTLENIRQRIDLREDDTLRRAALSRSPLSRLALFRHRLTDEADRIDTIGGSWVEIGLDGQLHRIYELAAKRTDLRLAARLQEETRTIARELVEFEEQMYLLDYEIGLSIYRRLRKEDARRPTEAENLEIPVSGDRAYYAFDEEFWNDELPAYTFFIENRCFDEGEHEQ